MRIIFYFKRFLKLKFCYFYGTLNIGLVFKMKKLWEVNLFFEDNCAYITIYLQFYLFIVVSAL